jgi:hypothetical protein
MNEKIIQIMPYGSDGVMALTDEGRIFVGHRFETDSRYEERWNTWGVPVELWSRDIEKD